MKKLIAAVLLTAGLGGVAHTHPPAVPRVIALPVMAWYDIRENSAIRVDAAHPGSVFDWSNGRWMMGTAVPVAHLGSYISFGGGVFAPADGGKNVGMLNGGVKLNALTRPLISSVLNQIPRVRDNAPLVASIAEATTVGGSAGHDFNLAGREKVVLNTLGIFLGFELKFSGGTPKVE